MRILAVGAMYPPHHLGGYEVAWQGWVRHSRAAGHEVRVLATDLRLASASGPEDEDVHRDLRWYWRDHEFPAYGLRATRAIERHNRVAFDRHVAAFGPEVVCWWAMGGMSLSLMSRSGLPSAAVLGDEWPIYAPVVDRWWRVRRRLPGLPRIEDAARWVFVSEHLRRVLDRAGFHPREGVVAHNGIDLARFTPGPVRSWEWKLLYVGRLDRRKGVHVAIEALTELPPEAVLTVLGDGDPGYRRELEALAPPGGVRFDTVAPHEAAAAYRAADVLVFPSQWEEPFGLVPLEAMACGTPVVSTATGGSAEYTEDGVNALVASRESGAAGFAEAMERLAGDATLRARLREGGLRTAARFPESGFAEGVQAQLTQAVEGGSQSPRK